MNCDIVFKGIWLRLLNSKSFTSPDVAAIKNWAEDKGLSNVSVEDIETDVFVKMPAIKLTTA